MADLWHDQAAGLRRLLGRPQVLVVAFVAGSVGVGKSVVVANLAAVLAGQGREVLVLDENTDAGFAAFYGASPSGDLQQVIDGKRSLAEVLVVAARRIRILPVASVVTQLARLSDAEQGSLLDCFGELLPPADVVLVDSSLDHPLGFSPLALAAPETVIVVSPNRSAITEAYALIKKVSLGYAREHFRVLVNNARGAREARAIHDNIERVARSRKLAQLDYAGYVPFDEHLRQALTLCQPVAGLFPDSPAAQSFRAFAKDLLNWPAAGEVGGGLEHFVQQLLHLSHRIEPTAIYA